MLIVSCEHYKSDRFNLLREKSDIVADAVLTAAGAENAGSAAENADISDGIDAAELKKILVPLSDVIGADITLTGADGVALVCSEASPCSHTDGMLTDGVLDRISGGELCELSTLDGFYDKDSFVYIKRMELNGQSVLLLERLRENNLPKHAAELATAFAVSAAVVLSVAFTVIYTSAKRLLSPIKEMTFAAERFGEGDFTDKLRVTDENELGYLANSLNEMADSLGRIEDTRKTFISNVSHEFKTPMTTIGGFIDGILDGTIPKEQQEHYLKIVSAEVGRLSRLVRSMLNISKYETGELKPAAEDFDLLPVIVRTLESFEKRIEEKNINVLIEGGESLWVTGDPGLIGQVIYNLTDNAVKFTDEGGSIQFSFGEEDGMRVVRIRNSGGGLSESEISRVFDRFYKTDKSRGIDPNGVGLGLSIVSSIVKLHGGKVTVTSEQNKYTEFSFGLKKAVKAGS